MRITTYKEIEEEYKKICQEKGLNILECTKSDIIEYYLCKIEELKNTTNQEQ